MDGDPISGANGRPARIGDVAAAAGVSTATVSRALTHPERLRPDTRKKVLEAVHRLGYTPNEAARSLRAGASRMVLIVIPHGYSGAFFSGVINSIDAELVAAGYTVIVGALEPNEVKARRLVDLVYARQIDGLIVFTGRVPIVDGRSLLDAGVPVVGVCAELDRPGLPCAVVNDEECAQTQTRHLIDLGHRRLLYLSGPPGQYNEVRRFAGFQRAAKAAKLTRDDWVRLEGDYTMASGGAAARQFMQLADRPTGVVCCSDEMAIGFVKTVSQLGLRCPEEVSVVGFDGIEFADYCEPTLTTIRQPRAQLGAEGARMLLRAMAGEKARTNKVMRLDGELVVRDSTGPRRS